MKTTQMNYLTHQHVEVQLWKQEIAFVSVELPLLKNLLSLVDRDRLPASNHAQLDELSGRMAHFQRLLPGLQSEIERYDHEVVEAWQQQQYIPAELKLDHRYLRQKMEDFHHDYAGFKRNLRAFVVWHESLVA